MMADFKPTQDLHGMNAVYLYLNATQSALFRNFSDLDGNWNGLSVSDVFGDEEIKIGYTYGWLKTSENMVRIFIVLSLAIIIMTAAVSAIYLFPVILPIAETSPLFRSIALLPLYHAQFVSLISVDQMGSGVLYAILGDMLRFRIVEGNIGKFEKFLRFT